MLPSKEFLSKQKVTKTSAMLNTHTSSPVNTKNVLIIMVIHNSIGIISGAQTVPIVAKSVL